MRFSYVWTGALLGSVLFLGCASEDDALRLDPSHTTSKQTTTVNATLAFEETQALDLTPGETREITVVASPSDEYDLYFALRDAPADAFLDSGHLVAGLDGRATVRLHAPGTPASFTLRAWINNGPTAELPVTVSKQGVGTVEVVPDYGGQRPVTEWIASVAIGTTCAALAGQLPGEIKGALVATAPAQQDPLIQSIPVGPKLAISLRAGHFAWGCADAHNIAAGTSTKVKVHVVDVPAALDRTKLDVALDYAPDAGPYGKLLDSARGSFLDAFFPRDYPESATLLDTMGKLAKDPIAFQAARYTGDWDALAEAHFAGLPAPVAARMNEWLGLGLGSATPKITGQLASIDGVPGQAMFMATQIGGLDAASAGAPPVHLLSWTAQPDDKVQLSGTLYWIPSRLLGTACVAGVAQDLGAPSTMIDALASAAACEDLAFQLGGVDACDAICLEALCRSALEQRWYAARNVSAESGIIGTIEVGATGSVQVDDTAMPTSLLGSWLGQVSDGTAVAAASGKVSGVLATDDSGQQNPSPGDPPQ